MAIEEPGRRFYVLGRYLTLERPHRLSFTWSCSTWANPDLESIVSVSLEPQADGQTLMTIEHALLPEHLVDQHEDGWTKIANQLESKLRSGRAVGA